MKTIYVVTPFTENMDEAKIIFDNASERLQESFSEDELNFESITPYNNNFDKHMLALREFIETVISNDEIIFFFAGNFIEDPFCMSAMTICKMYHLPAMLDKRVIAEDYKKDLESSNS